MKPARYCEVQILGRVDYLEAWKYQEDLAGEIGRGLRPPRLLLLEHPPTYTFGRRGKPEHLLWGEAELKQRGIQVHWVDRGGDVTYHGPGQLVGYPLLPLGLIDPGGGEGSERLPRVDYLGYIRTLEQVLIQALSELGFQAYTIAGSTGVWVTLHGTDSGYTPGPAKIAAIGVKIDARGVTRHGFALNVNPDREHWQGIIPCGLVHASVTSLSELTSALPSMKLVYDKVIAAFGRNFGFELKLV
jgi:lipoate-protein ligase B